MSKPAISQMLQIVIDFLFSTTSLRLRVSALDLFP